ncbi:DUF4879 domain-containing protein [Algicola sagamiensis]|uniref:DUF4879 domain-containing protein n=1 Tax=Algicola sagamiensis TaxID=163869 RepID=UPI0003703566|nr:DUF4879 domain-containing protein [Algicola sagamiensis]
MIILCLPFLAAVVISFYSFHAHALVAEIQAGIVHDGYHESENRSGFLLKYPIKFDHTKTLMDEQVIGERSNEYPTSVAQGVSMYEVYAVGSSNKGWEYVHAAQQKTTKNHGGHMLYIAVLQFGYGSIESAKLNDHSTHVRFRYDLCGKFNRLHPCRVGEFVTGRLYLFEFSSIEAGIFHTLNHSSTYPYGSWEDKMIIN